MQFKPEGEWMVGSPILAGPAGAFLDAASSCLHPSWTEELREVRMGTLIVFERCGTCRLATRGKYRPVKKEESA